MLTLTRWKNEVGQAKEKVSLKFDINYYLSRTFQT